IHRKAIRTTNVIERAFEELRRRTKVIPRLFTEKSCLKLAFAELMRVGQRSLTPPTDERVRAPTASAPQGRARGGAPRGDPAARQQGSIQGRMMPSCPCRVYRGSLGLD